MNKCKKMLNTGRLCCTMNKCINFIIGDKNVKKRKTPGAQARAYEKGKLVYPVEDVAAGTAHRGMRSSVRSLWSSSVCLCKVEYDR